MHVTHYIVAALLLNTVNMCGAASAAAAAASAKDDSRRPPFPIKPRLSIEAVHTAAGGERGEHSLDKKVHDAKKEGSALACTSTTYTLRKANREIPKIVAHVDFIARTCVNGERSHQKNLEGIEKYLNNMQKSAEQAMKDANEKQQQLIQQHGAEQQASSTASSPDEVVLPESFSSGEMYTYVKNKAGQIERFGSSLQQGSSYATLQSLRAFVGSVQKLTVQIPEAQKKLKKAIENAKKKEAAKKQVMAKTGAAAASSSTARSNTTPTPLNTPVAGVKVAAAASAARGAPLLPPLPKKPRASSTAADAASSSASSSASAGASAPVYLLGAGGPTARNPAGGGMVNG